MATVSVLTQICKWSGGKKKEDAGELRAGKILTTNPRDLSGSRPRLCQTSISLWPCCDKIILDGTSTVSDVQSSTPLY